MSRTAAEKLGYKPWMSVRIEGAPPELTLDLPDLGPQPHDLLLWFVRSAAEVEAAAAVAEPLYHDGARLWFAYPKKSGAIRTELTRDRGWGAVAALDLLGVTQVALDDTWSALRFRRRREIKTLTRRSERQTNVS